MALNRDVEFNARRPRIGQRFVRSIGAQFCYCKVITRVANGIRVVTRLGPAQRCPILAAASSFRSSSNASWPACVCRCSISSVGGAPVSGADPPQSASSSGRSSAHLTA